MGKHKDEPHLDRLSRAAGAKPSDFENLDIEPRQEPKADTPPSAVERENIRETQSKKVQRDLFS